MKPLVVTVGLNGGASEAVAGALEGADCEIARPKSLDDAFGLLRNPENLKRVSVLVLAVPRYHGRMLGFVSFLRSTSYFEQTPIIAVAASDDPEDLLVAYGAGVDYVVDRTVTAQQLLFGLQLIAGQGEGDDARCAA